MNDLQAYDSASVSRLHREGMCKSNRDAVQIKQNIISNRVHGRGSAEPDESCICLDAKYDANQEERVCDFLCGANMRKLTREDPWEMREVFARGCTSGWMNGVHFKE